MEDNTNQLSPDDIKNKPKFIGGSRLKRGPSVVANLGKSLTDLANQNGTPNPVPSPTEISRGDIGALDYRILFAGSNEEHEIESLEEFFEKTKGEPLELFGWNFQAVDFSSMDLKTWNTYKWNGAVFLGCKFPEGITPPNLRAINCQVWENPTHVPFTAFRSQLYNQQDMEGHDAEIAAFYTKERDFSVRIAESMHDFSMRDALFDYLEGKTPVGVMGSHSLKRGSAHYALLVHLGRKLAQAGFLVVTGGGAGAMEAANLGAYLADKSDQDVEEALSIIKIGNEGDLEFLNATPAINVIKRFGYPTHMPSLGIPTWRYSKEPFNRFATYHAKFFSNALREDGLVHICRGGIVFGQGGPGTRQEVFQAACVNHEQADILDQCPLIFLDEPFWTDNGVYDVVFNTSKGAPFHNYLLLTNGVDKAVEHLINHAADKRLPRFTDLANFGRRFW